MRLRRGDSGELRCGPGRLLTALAGVIVLILVLSGVHVSRRAMSISSVVRNGGSIEWMKCPEWIPDGMSDYVPQWMHTADLISFASGSSVDLNELRFITEVRGIRLDGVTVRGHGLRNLSRCPKLELLVLRGASFDETELDVVVTCRHLAGLDLSSTPVGDGAVERIIALPLVAVDLSGTNITDATLRRIDVSRLRVLSVSETEISDDGMIGLATSSLERLRIARTRVSDSGLRLISHLPLIALDLAGTNVSDDAIAAISGMPLAELNLSGTSLTDAGMRNVAQLGVSHLDISGTRVSDRGLDALAGCALRYLDLRDTDVTDDGLVRLETQERLRTLALSNPPISRKAAERLARSLHMSVEAESGVSLKCIVLDSAGKP